MPLYADDRRYLNQTAKHINCRARHSVRATGFWPQTKISCRRKPSLQRTDPLPPASDHSFKLSVPFVTFCSKTRRVELCDAQIEPFLRVNSCNSRQWRYLFSRITEN